MSKIAKMTDLNLKNQRVLIREDFNVPMENGKITSDARLRAALPTIKLALDQNAKVILTSHLGRPEEGEFDPSLSLKPIANHLSKLLEKPVKFHSDWAAPLDIQAGEVVLMENVRFNSGEKKDDPALAKKMADLCDIFVMDAFGTAHRAEASTHGIAKYAPIACAGPLLASEIDALTRALLKPQHPMVAIVGGSKVSSKLAVLESLVSIADQLIVGGGIANTFIAAAGFSVGKSLYEPSLLDQARQLMQQAKARGAEIPIPEDVVVANEFSPNAIAHIKPVTEITKNDMILDIGPATAKRFATMLNKAKTILWNGPVGVFEFDAFANGTKELTHAIAASHAFSIAGGGDTLAAIDKYQVADKISYISTGGGAFLEFVEGKTLPAIAILEERANI